LLLVMIEKDWAHEKRPLGLAGASRQGYAGTPISGAEYGSETMRSLLLHRVWLYFLSLNTPYHSTSA
jgi:hypothetical protein